MLVFFYRLYNECKWAVFTLTLTLTLTHFNYASEIWSLRSISMIKLVEGIQ